MHEGRALRGVSGAWDDAVNVSSTCSFSTFQSDSHVEFPSEPTNFAEKQNAVSVQLLHLKREGISKFLSDLPLQLRDENLASHS